MVRKRSRANRGAGRGAALVGFIAAVAGRICARMARRPVDSVAIIGAAAASVIIVVNAVFLQSGSQRAPFVANPTAPPQVADNRADVPTQAPTAGAAVRPVSQQIAAPATARRSDPIADLIGSSVASVRGRRAAAD
jgi:hypothetical protein